MSAKRKRVSRLSHVDDQGRIRMVDVSAKARNRAGSRRRVRRCA